MSINIIGDLYLEVTRQCNMECPHCCRGNAQMLDMDVKFVKALLSQVKSIGMLGFTGGEPTLVPHVLFGILKVFKETRTPIVTIELVTNGKDITSDFVQVWHQFMDYCQSPGASKVFVSGDDYHETVDITGFRDFFGCDVTLRRLEYVVAEGRKRGDRTLSRLELFDVEIDNECVVSPLYLSCLGDLLSGVDSSYANHEAVKICNVMNTDIMQAIKNWSK